MPNKVNTATGSMRSAKAKPKSATKKPTRRTITENEDYGRGVRVTSWRPQPKKGYRSTSVVFDNTGMSKTVVGPKGKGKRYDTTKKMSNKTTATTVRRASKAY